MASRAANSSITAMTFALLTSACASLSPSESSLPVGAVEVAAPAMYREWHAKTQTCSGLEGKFSTLKFYIVPGVETFPTIAGPKVGEWMSHGGEGRIVIAGNYQDHEMVVRHELLHSLLQAEGHPPEYFVNRCRLTWESWNGTRGSASVGSMD